MTNDASRLLDGELTQSELSQLLGRLRDDPALRDAVTIEQLVRDAVAGLSAPDDGYTLRILARLREVSGGS